MVLGIVQIAAAECSRCGVRVERSVLKESLPFRAICGACGNHVTLPHPRERNGAGTRTRVCLDCGRRLASITAADTARGTTRGVRLWVCRACRVHHRQDEPGQDDSRFFYLWSRSRDTNGEGEP